MKGFIRHSGKGLFALAASALLMGCRSLDCCNDSCGPDCGPNACQADCSDGCGHGSIGQRLENFDWEQVYPDHCWPYQYARESQARVYAPLRAQMIEGNKVELTLWPFYFSNEKGKEDQLTQAGEARLRYLARKRPYVIPHLLLQTSFDHDLDARRTTEIVDYASKVSLDPVAWSVTLVNSRPTGLFGVESSNAIDKMIGNEPVLRPTHEQFVKPGFFSGTTGGGSGGSQ